ncbi:hypothetical protein Acr_25g0001350 [Actinidia rufa]|uniref:Uncharacterized protein n=1 Tax=Actinidia rufa TaxID=165716 RepID=A0A7J0GY48_9ERIC|nr:hypothetical protein Acr_25g0001350 [Actinidia rufa]
MALSSSSRRICDGGMMDTNGVGLATSSLQESQETVYESQHSSLIEALTHAGLEGAR